MVEKVCQCPLIFEPIGEFEPGIEHPQAVVGRWGEGNEQRLGVKRESGTLPLFRNTRAAKSSGWQNLSVKHWSLGRFNRGFL